MADFVDASVYCLSGNTNFVIPVLANIQDNSEKESVSTNSFFGLAGKNKLFKNRLLFQKKVLYL